MKSIFVQTQVQRVEKCRTVKTPLSYVLPLSFETPFSDPYAPSWAYNNGSVRIFIFRTRTEIIVSAVVLYLDSNSNAFLSTEPQRDSHYFTSPAETYHILYHESVRMFIHYTTHAMTSLEYCCFKF
jgi:hypothetical protein